MTSSSPIKILGISGSLRKASFNTMALRAAQSLAPPDVSIERYDISGIPFYNGDVEELGFPQSVQDFRAAIKAADAVLVVTPEYNASIPGVLKNAFDWSSRPPDQPFDGKPIGIMGASPGVLGTVRSQAHLRQMFQNMNGLVLAQPQVLVGGAGSRFDAEGNLIDEPTGKFISKLIESLRDWTLKLRG